MAPCMQGHECTSLGAHPLIIHLAVQAIRIAYDILSNDLRRKQYDEHGRGGWTDMGRRPKSGVYPYYAASLKLA